MKKIVLALCFVLTACGGGGGGSEPEVQAEPQPQYLKNQFAQLVSDTEKTEVPCPPQTAQTMVAFVFGQSNAANHADYKTEAVSPRIVNYYNGKCYAAADPLLGATGTGGSQWVATANKMLDKYDSIVLISTAVAGSSITRWTGDLNASLVSTMDEAKSHYNVTHFIWHQGEADALKMAQADYAASLTQLIHQTKAVYPASRLYVSVVSYCGGKFDPAIQDAQRSVVDPINGVFQGISTDLLGAEYRFDGCHFNQTGISAASGLWADLFKRP